MESVVFIDIIQVVVCLSADLCWIVSLMLDLIILGIFSVVAEVVEVSGHAWTDGCQVLEAAYLPWFLVSFDAIILVGFQKFWRDFVDAVFQDCPIDWINAKSDHEDILEDGCRVLH